MEPLELYGAVLQVGDAAPREGSFARRARLLGYSSCAFTRIVGSARNMPP